MLACTTATASTKAVLSPPAVSRPWNVIVCDPAVTVNDGGGVALVRRARGREGAHDHAVDQDAEVLPDAW